MTDFTARFQQLVSDLTTSDSQEADLLLLQLPPSMARLVRLCAIPHLFDASVLRVLEPALALESASETMEEFRALPAINPVANCLALHDVVRRQLFLQWLAPESREEFQAVSSRLAIHFQAGPVDDAAGTTVEFSHIFHLVGADFDEGFRDFQRTYAERRDRSRFSDCAALVRLLREYEPVLPPHQLSWLKYYEAEIADDNRDWAQAVQRLDQLLQQDIPDAVRCQALLRSGSLLRRMKRLDDAVSRCRQCLALLARRPDSDLPARLVHHELGIIARDGGNFDEAKTELESALELANREGDRIDVAMAYNSLGTLLLQAAPQDAVAALKKCMERLYPGQDSVKIAQVLNNLAIAYANAGDWSHSESHYVQSLTIKREAGDLHGLASTLLNVARVYRKQQKSHDARNALLESAVLFERTKDAAMAARVHRELARLARTDGVAAEADRHAAQALELFVQSSDDAEAAATRLEFSIGPRKKWNPKVMWLIALGLPALAAFIFLLVVLFERD
jgi:tetratricopeptide (TPR) repeat protein